MDRQQLLVLPVVFCSQITVVSVTRARSVGLIATSGVFPVTVSVHRDSSTQSSTTPVKRVSMSESTPGGHVAQWIHTVAYTHTYTPPPHHHTHTNLTQSHPTPYRVMPICLATRRSSMMVSMSDTLALMESSDMMAADTEMTCSSNLPRLFLAL